MDMCLSLQPGSFEIVHVKDAVGHSFATRLQNVFVIGKGNKPWISLPKGNGLHGQSWDPTFPVFLFCLEAF